MSFLPSFPQPRPAPSTVTSDDGSSVRDRVPAPPSTVMSTPGARTPSEHASTPFATATAATTNVTASIVPPPPELNDKSDTIPRCTLPPDKVFQIQVGSQLFKLSGASIASDDQLRQTENGSSVRTLYIDRDPTTFQEIAKHLQGYHIRPTDGVEFVKLFADAQFYSLPRLISQLFEADIFIQIGERHFQIPRDVFSSPGDSPNFFTLGVSANFSSPSEVFPGLDRTALLRPPAISPPSLPNRSGEVFAELLHLLRGYPLQIRDENHRAELLRDCRYFHLRGLEQRLIAHHISYNLTRRRSEIVIRLDDLSKSGVQVSSDHSANGDHLVSVRWVRYSRPWVDDAAHELVVEIAGESTVLDLAAMRANFHGETKTKVARLLHVVADKMNLPITAPLGLLMMSGDPGARMASPGYTPISEDRVKVWIDRDTDVVLDGEPYDCPPSTWGTRSPSTPDPPLSGPIKRRRPDDAEERGPWVILRGQWRLRVQPTDPGAHTASGMELVLVAVKLDASSQQRSRNRRRGFLC